MKDEADVESPGLERSFPDLFSAFWRRRAKLETADLPRLVEDDTDIERPLCKLARNEYDAVNPGRVGPRLERFFVCAGGCEDGFPSLLQLIGRHHLQHGRVEVGNGFLEFSVDHQLDEGFCSLRPRCFWSLLLCAQWASGQARSKQ
jgi:hypothetical protein